MLWVSVLFVLMLVLSVLNERDDDINLDGKSVSSSIRKSGPAHGKQVNVHDVQNYVQSGKKNKKQCSINGKPFQCEAGHTPKRKRPNGTMADLSDPEIDADFGMYKCENSKCTAKDAEEATKKMYALGATPPPDVPAEIQGKQTVMPGVEYVEFKKLKESGSNTRVLRLDVNVGRKCPCIGHGQHVDGLATWASWKNDSGAYLVAYPADFGFNCKAWDLNRHPACRVDKQVPDWCFKPWCYVDMGSCHANIRDYENGSYFNWNEGDGFIKKMQY